MSPQKCNVNIIRRWRREQRTRRQSPCRPPVRGAGRPRRPTQTKRQIAAAATRAKESSESTSALSILLDNESVKNKSSFFLCFSFLSLFSVCFAESISPTLLRQFPSDLGSFPVIQSNSQSISQIPSQPVKFPVNQSNSQSTSRICFFNISSYVGSTQYRQSPSQIPSHPVKVQ